MKKYKIIVAIFVMLGFLNMPNFVFGQYVDIDKEVESLNKEIQSKKDRISEIERKQKFYSESIINKQKEQATLGDQLSILDNRILKAELDIENAQVELDKLNLEIKKTNLEIENKSEQIEREKDHVANLLQLIYKQNNTSALEVILLNDSLTDFLNQVKYLEDANSEIVNSLDELNNYKKQLEKNKEQLDVKNQQLDEAKFTLEQQKLALDDEKNNKENILVQTKESEKSYQKLLAQVKKEQEQAAADIVNMEREIRAKLAAKKDKPLSTNPNGFIWPVPKNVVTSYFHDPEYPFRNLFEHPAIDIRAGQGTQIVAPADGYVARININGTKYGYIMLIHGDGLSTVYGHTSKALVSPDEYVSQGQVIGLSGGMPGSIGSGALTSGPHLHFEVRLNGIPVNPLEYLP